MAFGLHDQLDRPLVLVSSRNAAPAAAPAENGAARAPAGPAEEEDVPVEPVVPDLPAPDAPAADNVRHRSALITWGAVAPEYPAGTPDDAKGSYQVLYELQLVQVGGRRP